MSEPSVTTWIDQLKAGDQQAAQPLWERYFAELARLAHRRLQQGSRAVADGEDVALSAFASFCQAAEAGRFPRLEDRDDLWRLLMVITERKAAKQVRDQRRLKRGGGKVVSEAALESDSAAPGLAGFADAQPTPDFAVAVAEECRVLLNRLGDDALRRIALAKMEGFSNDDIARDLDTTTRTIERKLALIRLIWSAYGPAPA
jgi:DNA-directed RNA polymerase specialized sigma24 family protein